jgi:hypothetical protein
LNQGIRASQKRVLLNEDFVLVTILAPFALMSDSIIYPNGTWKLLLFLSFNFQIAHLKAERRGEETV